MVTLTKRRVYVILFFARPLGVFFFSCGSTWHTLISESVPKHLLYRKPMAEHHAHASGAVDDAGAYLWSLRLDLAGTCQRSVDLAHVRGRLCVDVLVGALMCFDDAWLCNRGVVGGDESSCPQFRS